MWLILLMSFNFVLTSRLTQRIIGGRPCPIKKYSYTVSIHIKDFGSSSHYCGGTILNLQWILTAAHCFRDEEISGIKDYVVFSGLSNQSHMKSKNVQKRKITKVITNNYDSNIHGNDIALLQLNKPLRKDDSIDFVILPEQIASSIDLTSYFTQSCVAIGWGLLVPIDTSGILQGHGPLYPDDLMCVDLPPISLIKCQQAFDDLVTGISVTEAQMCTMYPTGEKDACSGDSGGPLICKGIQEGITSWGLGCAQPGLPGVFTRVDRYTNWIKMVVGDVKVAPSTKPMPRNAHPTPERKRNHTVQFTFYLVCFIYLPYV